MSELLDKNIEMRKGDMFFTHLHLCGTISCFSLFSFLFSCGGEFEHDATCRTLSTYLADFLYKWLISTIHLLI